MTRRYRSGKWPSVGTTVPKDTGTSGAAESFHQPAGGPAERGVGHAVAAHERGQLALVLVERHRDLGQHGRAARPLRTGVARDAGLLTQRVQRAGGHREPAVLVGRRERDPDADVGDAVGLGRHERGDLGGLAGDDVRPPVLDQVQHVRERGPRVRAHEQLGRRDRDALEAGAAGHHPAHLGQALRSGGSHGLVGQRGPVGELRDLGRPGDEHVVPGVAAGLGERDQRGEVAGAAGGGEEDAHVHVSSMPSAARRESATAAHLVAPAT